MASTTSPRLGIEVQTRGEKTNTWGQDGLNDALLRLEEAIADVATLTITGNVTLTATNWVANQARAAVLKLTGAPGATYKVTIPGVEKNYHIHNATASDQTIGTSGGVAATIRAGQISFVYCDGTDTTVKDPTLDKIKTAAADVALGSHKITGMADGYYRMTDKPASTLLHLGPGLANAAANLHNAKKAGSGIVNIVGEHALYHIKYDTPLTADIEGIARPFSHWVKTSPTAKTVAADGAAAIQAARVAPGQIATLILPADTAWTEADGVAETPATPAPPAPSSETVVAAAKAQGCELLLSLELAHGLQLDSVQILNPLQAAPDALSGASKT